MFAQDERKEKSTFAPPQNPQGETTLFQVSDSRDGAEQSARETADSVMGGGLFREGEGSFAPGGEARLSNLDLAGAGESLPTGLQGQMEQAMGADFSQVRVHTGAGAARASRQISARAFARGQDLYFGQGNYDPHSQEGQHLIAHELAHVAAGDGGIHRDPASPSGTNSGPTASSTAANLARVGTGVTDNAAGNAQGTPAQQPQLSPEEERRNKAQEEMVNSTLQSLALSSQTTRTILSAGTFKTIALQAKGGTLNKGDLEQKKTSLVNLKTQVEEKSTQIQQKITDFTSAQSALGEQNEQQKSAVQRAQDAKDKLGLAKGDLDQAVQAMDFGLEQSTLKETRQQGKAFSSPVRHMLESAAGEQFFKAVADVNKGAQGTDVEAVENEVFRGPAGKKMKEGGKEGRWDTAGKVLGIASPIIGIAGTANSVISGGTEINEAIHGENAGEASENASDYANVVGVVTDTAGAAADIASGVIESKQLHDQESARKRKIQEMQQTSAAAGKLKSADHTARVGNAGSWAGTVGSIVSAGNSIGSVAEGKNYNETKGNIASVVGDSFGVAGDILGLASNSDTARKQHKQDARAKQNMRNLGAQLRSTISGQEGRNVLLTRVCDRVDMDNYNSKKLGRRLSDLIEDAIAGQDSSNPAASLVAAGSNAAQTRNATSGRQRRGSTSQGGPGSQGGRGGSTPAQPDYAEPALTSRQKGLLISLSALEKSRENSKDAASSARKDTFFDVVGTLGDMVGLAASSLRLKKHKLLGAALGFVSTMMSAVGGIRDTVNMAKENIFGDNDAEDKERNIKIEATRAAVRQMAALPPLSYGALSAAMKNDLTLAPETMNIAEEYAAVFSILESANVNMVDFLYAVHKGQFGGKKQDGSNMDMKQSLTAMYNAMDL